MKKNTNKEMKEMQEKYYCRFCEMWHDPKTNLGEWHLMFKRTKDDYYTR